MTTVLVTILGLVASATLVLSALSVHRTRLLSFSILTGLIVSAQYVLSGSITGFATNLVGTTRTAFVLGSAKKPWLNHWFWIPFFMLAHILVFSFITDWGNLKWFSLLPLVGGLGGVLAVFFRKVKYIKIAMLCLGAIWMTYEFNNQMFTYMIGETFTFIANVAALVTLLNAERKGIPANSVEDVDTKLIETVTHSIPTLTKELRTITRAITVPIQVQRKSGIRSQVRWLLTGAKE